MSVSESLPIPVSPPLPANFLEISLKDRADVIFTTVAPIFLVIALSLSIYYGCHPIQPMIPITADFSISLPILICSSTGVGLAIICVIQMIRGRRVQESYDRHFVQIVKSSPSLQRTVRRLLHPDKGFKNGSYVQSVSGIVEAKKETYEVPFYPTVYKARDGTKLSGFLHAHDDNQSTVILFHGNGQTANEMAALGSLYASLNFNVFLAEYRGFGSSEGKAGGEKQEIEAYMDAEAAYACVKEKLLNPGQILVHGYSLGGAYAAALGYFYGISHVVLSHTFTDYASVIENFSPTSIFSKGVVDVSYDRSEVVEDHSFSSIPQPERHLIGDGFDSLNKVRSMQGAVFVIQGKEDHLMPIKFGKALVEAKYHSQTDQEAHLVTINGGHCDMENFFDDPKAMTKFLQFLENGGYQDERPRCASLKFIPSDGHNDGS